MSPQEATVRAAYASVVIADRLYSIVNSPDWELGKPELSIRIEDVHAGPISDILDDRLDSRVTVPSGDVLTTSSADWSFEKTHLASAISVNQWQPADNTYGDLDPQRMGWKATFREIFQKTGWQPSAYADYTVALSAHGRERRYRAMFFFEAGSPPAVKTIDYILGSSWLDAVIRAGLPKELQQLPGRIEAAWTTSLKRSGIDDTGQFAKERAAGARQLLEEAAAPPNCIADAVTGLCCDPASGRCGVQR